MSETNHSIDPSQAPQVMPDQVVDEASLAAHRLLDGPEAIAHSELAPSGPITPAFASEVIASNPNVLNKKDWHEAVERIVPEAVKNGQVISLMFLDLDTFKAVNDSLGHSRGDEAIEDTKGLVSSTSEQFRTGQDPGRERLFDLVSIGDDQPVEPIEVENEAVDMLGGHVGGDEFAVLIYGDASVAQVVETRLRDNFESYLEKPENADLKKLGVGMSIGMATSDENTTSASELLKEADAALTIDKIKRLRPLDPMQRQLFDKAVELLLEAKVRPRDIDKYLRKYPEIEQKDF